MDVRSDDQILQETFVLTAMEYCSVRNLRDFPAPHLTDEETEAQRRQ